MMSCFYSAQGCVGRPNSAKGFSSNTCVYLLLCSEPRFTSMQTGCVFDWRFVKVPSVYDTSRLQESTDVTFGSIGVGSYHTQRLIRHCVRESVTQLLRTPPAPPLPHPSSLSAMCLPPVAYTVMHPQQEGGGCTCGTMLRPLSPKHCVAMMDMNLGHPTLLGFVLG